MELVPGVLSDLLDVDSLVWVGYEDLCDEIPAAVRDESRQCVLCVEDLLV